MKYTQQIFKNFKNNPQVIEYVDYFCKKICDHDLAKIAAPSGHAATLARRFNVIKVIVASHRDKMARVAYDLYNST